jgi:hypothetical protein
VLFIAGHQHLGLLEATLAATHCTMGCVVCFMSASHVGEVSVCLARWTKWLVNLIKNVYLDGICCSFGGAGW